MSLKIELINLTMEKMSSRSLKLSGFVFSPIDFTLIFILSQREKNRQKMDENVPLQVLYYDDQRMLPSLMSSLQERCELNDQLYERATGTERSFRKVKNGFFSNF